MVEQLIEMSFNHEQAAALQEMFCWGGIYNTSIRDNIATQFRSQGGFPGELQVTFVPTGQYGHYTTRSVRLTRNDWDYVIRCCKQTQRHPRYWTTHPVRNNTTLNMIKLGLERE